jgi:hypothetical protein
MAYDEIFYLKQNVQQLKSALSQLLEAMNIMQQQIIELQKLKGETNG